MMLASISRFLYQDMPENQKQQQNHNYMLVPGSMSDLLFITLTIFYFLVCGIYTSVRVGHQYMIDGVNTFNSIEIKQFIY